MIPYEQRKSVLQGIAIVDEVICGPKLETEEFYRELNIDVHCQGNDIDGFFGSAKRMGILKILGRSNVTETTEIIRRVIDRCCRTGPCTT